MIMIIMIALRKILYQEFTIVSKVRDQEPVHTARR